MSVKPWNIPTTEVIFAQGEQPIFRVGDKVRIATRQPVGHYRVPRYIRGKVGTIETVLEPVAINNEQEGFGRNAGAKRHYYRIVFPLAEIWPNYTGSQNDGLRIEVYETWLDESPRV